MENVDFIYEDMLKRLNSRISKQQKIKIVDAAKKYAIFHEKYEDIALLTEIENGLNGNKKNRI